MTKEKTKKMKTTKIYLFLLPPLPSQDGGGGGVPHPPTFSTVKIFEICFHRYMGIWTKGGEKRKNGTRENLKGGGGCNNPPPPPEREG